jgi:LacI family transcriptional regulator
MITIKDVATLAGVSFTTVSHVVNNTRRVSTETRDRVESAIRQLHYVPSDVARSLRYNTTSTIGLLISIHTNPFFSELAHSIENTCYHNRHSVILCNSGDDSTHETEHLRALLQRRISGMIVAATGDGLFLSNTLREAHIPIVIVDRPLPNLETDLVHSDHYLGGKLAASHLIERNHRQIGFIGGPLDRSPTWERLHGFRSVLDDAGIELALDAIEESDFSIEGGNKAAQQLMATQSFSAICAANDLMAIGAMRFAVEKGIRVPEQLSLIGFDGIKLSQYTHPSLTTIDQAIKSLGEIAAATLIRAITREPHAAHEHHILKPSLVIRESTAFFL